MHSQPERPRVTEIGIKRITIRYILRGQQSKATICGEPDVFSVVLIKNITSHKFTIANVDLNNHSPLLKKKAQLDEKVHASRVQLA